ncbi:hypothetical protein ACE193_15305 [Bernardetia sp. OM2101]|uniref:hypothetical protein n=1 Tax=Bernardetia sp. OM2101 TaxID=3344876 RepID=UPI0035CF6251
MSNQNLLEVLTDTSYHSSAIYKIDIPVEEFVQKETFGSAHNKTTLLKGDVLQYLGYKTLLHGHNPYCCWLIKNSKHKNRVGKIFQMEVFNQSLINTKKVGEKLLITITDSSETQKETIAEQYMKLLSINNKLTLPYLVNASNGGAGSYYLVESLKNKFPTTSAIFVKSGYWNNMKFDILATDKDFTKVFAALFNKNEIHKNTFEPRINGYYQYEGNCALKSYLSDKKEVKSNGLYGCFFTL